MRRAAPLSAPLRRSRSAPASKGPREGARVGVALQLGNPAHSDYRATLWLSNVPPEATDDELRALAKKHATELEVATCRREAGDGTRPIAFMTFTGGAMGDVERLAERLNGFYWKDRKLGCTATF